jgi:hypothetical protein
MRTLSHCLLAGCVAALSGCVNSDWGTATGTVTLDGTALTKGIVTFHPVEGGPVATSSISSNGTFQAMTGAKPGLGIGAYKITVVEQTIPAIDSGENVELLTPSKYASVATTDLAVTIKSGHNPVDLILKK